MGSNFKHQFASMNIDKPDNPILRENAKCLTQATVKTVCNEIQLFYQSHFGWQIDDS